MGDPNQPKLDLERLNSLQKLERLTETMSDRSAGEWFQADLEEARILAQNDPRFESLAIGLQSETLGDRLDAINQFFDQIPAVELAALILPPNLSQLRAIYLSSRSYALPRDTPVPSETLGCSGTESPGAGLLIKLWKTRKQFAWNSSTRGPPSYPTLENG